MGRSLEELDSLTEPMAQDLLDQCYAAGIPLTVEDTGRDPETQDADIAAGRSWTKNSLHLPQPPEGKARAIDCVPTALLAQKQWGWYGTIENSDPRWKLMGEIGEGIGFEWGGRWPNNPPHSRPDPGHFQNNPTTNVEAVEDASTGEN
jgi:D-alanyl-D-alanine carboxypeptidase